MTKCCYLATNKTYSVSLSHANSPNDFFVQFTEQKERLENLQSDINSFYNVRGQLEKDVV